MKIGIVTEYYYPYLGGIAEHVHHTYLFFKKRGIGVKIITPRIYDRKSPMAVSDNGDIIYIGRSLPFYHNGGFVRFTSPIGLSNRLRKILDRECFDVLHVHSPLIPFLPIVALRVASCPVIGTFHTTFRRAVVYSMFRGAFSRLSQKLSARICVAPTVADQMSRYFTFETAVVPNGVDIAQFSPNISPVKELADPRKKTLLFLGRLDPHNRLDVLIHAFGRIHREIKNSRLFVVGDGPLRNKYEAMAKSVGAPVLFLGAQHALRPNLYRTADLFVQPADLHCFSIVNLEAMASGIPILASDIPAFRWQLREGAEYFSTGDPGALAEKAIDLLSSREKRMILSEKTRARAVEFSWDRIGEQILNIIKDSVERHQAERAATSRTERAVC